MWDIIGFLVFFGIICAAGIMQADNKKEKAKEIAAGTGLFLQIVAAVGAFFAGCFFGLLKWARKKGK